MAAHPFLAGLQPTLCIAHRGGASLAPENTLYAFERAVEDYGAEMIETDLQLSADGELVVFHDETLDRCTDGSGRVSDHTVRELAKLDAGYRFAPERDYPFRGKGLRIPTLRELLDAFPRTRLHLDLKVPGEAGERALARAVAGHAHRVCVGSAFDVSAERIHALLPDFCHFAPKRALTRFVLRAKLGLRPPDDPRWLLLSMPWRRAGFRLVDAHLLRVAKEAGKWVNVWTVDEEAEMRRLIALGVGGIMTDRPDRLRELLREA